MRLSVIFSIFFLWSFLISLFSLLLFEDSDSNEYSSSNHFSQPVNIIHSPFITKTSTENAQFTSPSPPTIPPTLQLNNPHSLAALLFIPLNEKLEAVRQLKQEQVNRQWHEQQQHKQQQRQLLNKYTQSDLPETASAATLQQLAPDSTVQMTITADNQLSLLIQQHNRIFRATRDVLPLFQLHSIQRNGAPTSHPLPIEQDWQIVNEFSISEGRRIVQWSVDYEHRYLIVVLMQGLDEGLTHRYTLHISHLSSEQSAECLLNGDAQIESIAVRVEAEERGRVFVSRRGDMRVFRVYEFNIKHDNLRITPLNDSSFPLLPLTVDSSQTLSSLNAEDLPHVVRLQPYVLNDADNKTHERIVTVQLAKTAIQHSSQQSQRHTTQRNRMDEFRSFSNADLFASLLLDQFLDIYTDEQDEIHNNVHTSPTHSFEHVLEIVMYTRLWNGTEWQIEKSENEFALHKFEMQSNDDNAERFVKSLSITSTIGQRQHHYGVPNLISISSSPFIFTLDHWQFYNPIQILHLRNGTEFVYTSITSDAESGIDRLLVVDQHDGIMLLERGPSGFGLNQNGKRVLKRPHWHVAMELTLPKPYRQLKIMQAHLINWPTTIPTNEYYANATFNQQTHSTHNHPFVLLLFSTGVVASLDLNSTSIPQLVEESIQATRHEEDSIDWIESVLSNLFDWRLRIRPLFLLYSPLFSPLATFVVAMIFSVLSAWRIGGRIAAAAMRPAGQAHIYPAFLYNPQIINNQQQQQPPQQQT